MNDQPGMYSTVTLRRSEASLAPVDRLVLLLEERAHETNPENRVVYKNEVDRITHGDWRIRNAALSLVEARHSVYFEKMTSRGEYGNLRIPTPEKQRKRHERAVARAYTALDRTHGCMKFFEPDLAIEDRRDVQAHRAVIGAAAELISPESLQTAREIVRAPGANIQQHIQEMAGRRKWR